MNSTPVCGNNRTGTPPLRAICRGHTPTLAEADPVSKWKGARAVPRALRRRDLQDCGRGTQDLFVFLSQERRGEPRDPPAKVSKLACSGTGDDHVPLGKRVLGAALRAFYVTVSQRPYTKRLSHGQKSALHARARTTRNVTHAGYRESQRERERKKE